MPTIYRGVATSRTPTEAQMAAKDTAKAPISEEAAIAEVLADHVDETGILHVPTTVEEHTKQANADQAEVNKLTGQDQPEQIGADAPADVYTRVPGAAWDGPLNVNERNDFDPLKPDTVSTVPR